MSRCWWGRMRPCIGPLWAAHVHPRCLVGRAGAATSVGRARRDRDCAVGSGWQARGQAVLDELIADRPRRSVPVYASLGTAPASPDGVAELIGELHDSGFRGLKLGLVSGRGRWAHHFAAWPGAA